MVSVLTAAEEAYDINVFPPPVGKTVNCIQRLGGDFFSSKQVPDENTVAWYKLFKVPKNVKERVYKEEDRTQQLRELVASIKYRKLWEECKHKFESTVSVMNSLETEMLLSNNKQELAMLLEMWRLEKKYLLELANKGGKDLREYMLEACSCGAYDNKNDEGIMLLPSSSCKLHGFNIKKEEINEQHY